MGGNKNMMHMVTFSLLAIGGLNWLLYGLLGTDVGAWVGGMDSMPAKVIYILVGLSAVYEIATHKANCKACEQMMAKKSAPMSGGGPATM